MHHLKFSLPNASTLSERHTSPSSGESCSYKEAESGSVGRADHLSMLVVDAEGDGGRVQEQPRLLLIHLLP